MSLPTASGASAFHAFSVPGGDLSVRLMDMLLGPGWSDLMTHGAAQAGAQSTMLGSLFSSVNSILLVFVAAILAWQVAIGSMQTAHEGQALGRRYHSIWTPVRAPLSVLMLSPLPWTSGYSLIQALILSFVYMSVGATDQVHSQFLNYIKAHDGVAMAPPVNWSSPGNKQLAGMLDNSLVTEYILLKAQNPKLKTLVTWEPTSNTSGRWVLGVTASQNASVPDKAFGMTYVPCSAPSSPSHSAGCLAVKNALVTIKSEMNHVAASIITTGNRPDPQRLITIQNQFDTVRSKVISQAWQTAKSNKPKIIDGFVSAGKDLGWASLAFYYVELNRLNGLEKADAAPATNVSVIKADLNSDYLQGITQGHAKKYLAAGDAFWLHTFNAYATATSGAVGLAGGNVNPNQSPVGPGFWSRVGSSLKSLVIDAVTGSGIGGNPTAAFHSFFSSEFNRTAMSLMAGSPVTTVMSVGNTMIDFSIGIFVLMHAGGVVKTVLGVAGLLGAAGTGGGSLFVAVMGIVGSTVLSMAGAIAYLLAGAFLAEGIVFAYIIPFIPTAVMTMAIIGWLILVIEMMIAGPLWAVAHAYAGGEGITPEQTKHGYAVLIGAVMRPMLLTFGFIFAWLMMKVAGFLIGLVMMIYGVTIGGTSMGMIDFAVLMGILAAFWGSAVYFIMRMITHLAQYVPIWLGGTTGSDLGVDSAAQQAAQSAQSGYARPMAAGAASFAGSQSAKAVNKMGDRVLDARAAHLKKGGEDGQVAEGDVQSSDTSHVGGGEGGSAGAGGGGSSSGGAPSGTGVDVADTQNTNSGGSSSVDDLE